MSASIELRLLKCVRCGVPVAAEEDEVAWLCGNCGQGLLLTDDGLAPLAVQWAALRPGSRVASWRPLWVFTGKVSFSARQTYGGPGLIQGVGNLARAVGVDLIQTPEEFWLSPRRFFVPAYACDLAHLERLGADLTGSQVALQPGSAQGALRGCTLLPAEARKAAEFVVLTIEADRRDKLRNILFNLLLDEPQLWIVPFGEGDKISV